MIARRHRQENAPPSRFAARIFVAGVWLLGALSLFVGCGGSSGGADPCTVSGTVSFRGKPLEEADIYFFPVDAPEQVCKAKIAQGKYEAPAEQELRPGKYTVSVIAVRLTGRKFADPDEPGAPGTLYEERQQYIPAKYNTQTELVAQLQPGANTYNLEL